MSETQVEEKVGQPPVVDSEFQEETSNLGSGGNSEDKRLYINNVSYQTTEDDLRDLLKDFKVISILIPSQTVRGFKSSHQRSLGIAYVDFESEEQATLAKEEISGKVLHQRQLRVKTFVPYSPKVSRSGSTHGSRLLGRRQKPENVLGSVDETQDKLSGEGNVDVENKASDTETKLDDSKSTKLDSEVESAEQTDESKAAQESKKEVSKDTVYIDRLSPKITDGDLRGFFHEFGPTDVYVFKSRFRRSGQKRLFHGHPISALVTLSTEDGLNKAIEALSETKLKGKRVVLRAAYLTKIHEVKKAAEARQKKLDKESKDEGSTGSQTATSALEPSGNSHDEKSTSEASPSVNENEELFERESTEVVQN